MNSMKHFIEERTKKKLISCINTPILIEQEYNRERADLKDYHGRELLELLQNADDEVTEDLPKKVLISFKNSCLKVSNFGTPFFEEGILSLMYSNVSAKRERLKETIGNKGTGFRSILSWAQEIEINSGDLHIRFSDEYSRNVVKNAFENNQGDDGKEFVSAIKNVATLAFPEWIENDDNTDEYTTTISIRIKDDQTISDDILKQIQNLDQNILLFLNNTEELKIETEDFDVLFVKKTVKGKTVLTKYVDNELEKERCWTTVKRDGTLIDENDDSKEKNYHVVVAFCDDEIEDKEKYLYSYFKTEEEFPYPFLVHASFELKGDRNHLTESEINKTLLNTVAETMVEAAIKAGTRKTANYDIVKKLIAEKTLSKTLAESVADFHKMVIEAVKNNEKPILPNVNGKYINDKGEKIVRYYNGLSKYLKGKDFGDLLQHMEKGSPVDHFINECIGTAYHYRYDYIAPKVENWVKKQKIKTDNEENNKEKIRNILKIALALFDEYNIPYYYDDDEVFPGLFFNNERNVIPGRTPVFVVDDEELHIGRLPKFARIEFMEPYMASFLLKYLRQDNGTEFDSLEDLADYNVRPFNTDEIIAHLNDCLEHSIENETPSQTKKKWKKVIKWIWDNKDCFHDKQISVYFLARDKKYYRSDQLYMGKEYGGTLLERLLGSFPSKIAADFRDNTGLDLTDEQIQEFMTILGIDRLPRINYELFKVYDYGRAMNTRSDYIGKVMSLLSFPYKLDGYDKFESLYDCQKRLTYIEFNGYKIEELEDILKTSRTEDIVEWIKKDSRLQDILFTWREGRNTKFEIKWDRKSNPRRIGELTRPYPYILYLFQSVPWIEVDKQRYRISDCLIDLSAKVDLSPYLISPDISEYIKNINGKPGKLRKEFISIFQKLGMKRGFSEGGFAELPASKIYAILMSLPEIEGSEEVAKDMYECLVAEMDDENIQCKERTDFLTNGKVLCNNGYVSISEAYYLAEKTVSDRIIDNFNIIRIGARQGSAKIEKLFGVKRIDIKGKVVGAPERHPQSQVFESEFQRFLPMAFACRLADIKSETGVKDEARKINSIEMILCTKVEAVYNDTIRVQLDDYEYILSEGHRIYIKAPVSLQRNGIRHNMDLSIAVAEALCSGLDIAGAVDSFRELFYCGTNKDRAEVIKSKYEDPTLVDRAKGYLEFREDVQDEFGRILKTIVGPDAIDQDVIAGLDYDDFSGIGNSRAIIKIFKELGIDISDYNAEDPSVEINLIPYYEGEIERLKPMYRDEYKISCFRRLENKSLVEKEFLVDDFLDFDQITITAENSVGFDVVSGIAKGLHIISDAKPINLADLYKRNLKNWKSRSTLDLNYSDEFFKDPKNMSLLYYREYKPLDERYEQYVNEQAEEEGGSTSIPSKQTLQEDTDSVIIPAELSHGKAGKPGKTTGFTKKESSAEIEKTGQIGEQLVYDRLRSDKSIKHVNWVSENAKKAGVNPEGRAGLGYDFEIINEDDERILIEVKASKYPIRDGIRFHLSDNEYSVALEYGKNYIVYYIGDARSGTPVLKKLTDLFDEDFNTEKYTVECKSDYTITAFTK